MGSTSVFISPGVKFATDVPVLTLFLTAWVTCNRKYGKKGIVREYLGLYNSYVFAHSRQTVMFWHASSFWHGLNVNTPLEMHNKMSELHAAKYGQISFLVIYTGYIRFWVWVDHACQKIQAMVKIQNLGQEIVEIIDKIQFVFQYM